MYSLDLVWYTTPHLHQPRRNNRNRYVVSFFSLSPFLFLLLLSSIFRLRSVTIQRKRCCVILFPRTYILHFFNKHREGDNIYLVILLLRAVTIFQHRKSYVLRSYGPYFCARNYGLYTELYYSTWVLLGHFQVFKLEKKNYLHSLLLV